MIEDEHAQRFSCLFPGGGQIRFVRHSMAVIPPDGSRGVLSGNGFNLPAEYRDGEWRSMRTGKPIKAAAASWVEVEGIGGD